MSAARISGLFKSRAQQDTHFPKTARINYDAISIVLSFDCCMTSGKRLMTPLLTRFAVSFLRALRYLTVLGFTPKLIFKFVFATRNASKAYSEYPSISCPNLLGRVS